MSQRRFVLIAAVSEYLHQAMPPLPGVRRDAERLRSTLERYTDGGVYRMFWLPDDTACKQDILHRLGEIASQAGTTDQVIVYFGGHGWRERDTVAKRWKYYLLPYDATFASPATHGLATDELGKVLTRMHAQELVVILDCCHSGGMTHFSWTADTLDELLAGWRSHYVMAASRGREEAGEDDTGGFFMQALCDALQGDGVTPDEKGRISVQKAWSYAADVANAEAARRGHEQVAVNAGIGSPIYLTRRMGKPSDGSPPPIQPMLQDGFIYGDYVTQLGDKSLPEEQRQRLIRLIEARDRLPPTWRNEILVDYLLHGNFQRLVDSLTHSTTERLVRATLLGSSHRSVCNEIQKGRLHVEFLDQLSRDLRNLDAPASVMSKLASILALMRSRTQTQDLLEALNDFAERTLLPWLSRTA